VKYLVREHYTNFTPAVVSFDVCVMSGDKELIKASGVGSTLEIAKADAYKHALFSALEISVIPPVVA
jgi:hypothetical protein